MKHLELWDAVEKTDPQYTKTFLRSGGFRGTAIDPTYLAKKATERWGPLGIGWNIETSDELLTDGHLLSDGTPAIVHSLKVTVSFKEGDEWGKVSQYGQTTFRGEDSGGVFSDEEFRKKSQTDGMSKCLSLLGFSADVYLGLFEASKYTGERQPENASGGGGRAAMQACPKCGKEAVIKGNPEYGGGWLCWKKREGCGEKWNDAEWESPQQPATGEKKKFWDWTQSVEPKLTADQAGRAWKVEPDFNAQQLFWNFVLDQSCDVSTAVEMLESEGSCDKAQEKLNTIIEAGNLV